MYGTTEVPRARPHPARPVARDCARRGGTEICVCVCVEQCCNAHDICYHTCKGDKQQKKGQDICDTEFEKCMQARCSSLKGQVQGVGVSV